MSENSGPHSATSRSVNEETHRLKEIDTMKGIGIILMVMGHCGFPGSDWIYLFHMAMFFIISGFCWNDKHADSWQNVKKYIKKRTIDLYLPFVVCNLVFLVLTNVLIRLNLYTDNPMFLEALGVNTGSNELIQPLRFPEMIRRGLSIMVLTGGTQLGGATWFFGVLYIVSAGHAVFSRIVRSIVKDKKSGVILSLLGLLGTVFSIRVMIAEQVQFTLREFIARIAIGYYAFLMGTGLKTLYMKTGFRLKPVLRIICAALSFVFLLIMAEKQTMISIVSARIPNLWSFTLCSLAGTTFVYMIATFITDCLQKVFGFIGKHTKSVVCFHLISFKTVTLIFIAVKRLPDYMLASFPILQDTGAWSWVLYSAAGIGVPLLIWFVSNRIRKLILPGSVQRRGFT